MSWKRRSASKSGSWKCGGKYDSLLCSTTLVSLPGLFLPDSFHPGLTVAAAAPWAIRIAERMRARNGARFLLALRLAPASFRCSRWSVSAFPVICGSNRKRRPRTSARRVWRRLSLARSLRPSLWSASHAVACSWRYIRRCRGTGEITDVAGRPAVVLEGNGHLVRLAGVFRPQVVISRDVIEHAFRRAARSGAAP